jgi:predicted enzyme related to lactoylglutathione lyase
MAKQRPVPPGGGKPANVRDRQAAPVRSQPAPAQPGPRRPFSGGPSDPRPIAGPLLRHSLPLQYPGPAVVPQPAFAAPDDHPGSVLDVGDDEVTVELPGLARDVAGLIGDDAPPGIPGHPAPGPRRTSPGENAALTATRPYPVSPATDRVGPTGPVTRPASGMPLTAGRTVAGSRHAPGQFTPRRTEPVGLARTPPPRSLLPGLQLQPMVHVADMATAVAFYESLGGEINHGDRTGEWVLMQVGTAQIGLVTRPPDASRGESTVELNFAATMPLDRLAQMLHERGVAVIAMATDPDLGVQLHVETPDGMPIRIHQVEPELMV